MHYTGTIWRPPYEAYSALVQVTAGCTHHKCKFCTLYEDVPFKFRMSPLSEVEEDLKEISRYYRNAKRVFFTGANPFVLSFDKLKTLAGLVKKYYPKSESIGCCARITDIKPKTTEQLKELRRLGKNIRDLEQRRSLRSASGWMRPTWITIFFISQEFMVLAVEK